MPIQIQPYTPDLIAAVKDFNERLSRGHAAADFLFPETHSSTWLPKDNRSNVFEEYFLAVEGKAVRGAFALKHQDFSFCGEMRRVAFYHMPLSEGLVNRKYVGVGVQMLRQAIAENPALFALGMGGLDFPLPRMLKAMGWSLFLVPLCFRVVHPGRFLTGITELRRTRSRRFLLNAASYSGVGWLGIKGLQKLRAGPAKPYKEVSCEPVAHFSSWSDDLWSTCTARYAMIGARDSDSMNRLYPSAEQEFCRLRVMEDGRTVGWVIVLDTQMRNNRHFGNLRVGTIVDCLAQPEDATAVIQAGTEFLEQQGVDLIVSNQSHPAWVTALRRQGYLRGRSNFAFAASKPLASMIGRIEEDSTLIHMTRGDGDGPLHLIRAFHRTVNHRYDTYAPEPLGL